MFIGVDILGDCHYDLCYMYVCRRTNHFYMLGTTRITHSLDICWRLRQFGFLANVSSWRGFYKSFWSNYQGFGILLAHAL